MGYERTFTQDTGTHGALEERNLMIAFAEKRVQEYHENGDAFFASELDSLLCDYALKNHIPYKCHDDEYQFRPIKQTAESAFHPNDWKEQLLLVEARARNLMKEHRDGYGLYHQMTLSDDALTTARRNGADTETIKDLQQKNHDAHNLYWSYKEDPRIMACDEIIKRVTAEDDLRIVVEIKRAIGQMKVDMAHAERKVGQ